MAPPKKAIWQNFSEVIVDGVKRAKCRKCEESVVNNPSRMERKVLTVIKFVRNTHDCSTALKENVWRGHIAGADKVHGSSCPIFKLFVSGLL